MESERKHGRVCTEEAFIVAKEKKVTSLREGKTEACRTFMPDGQQKGKTVVVCKKMSNVKNSFNEPL